MHDSVILKFCYKKSGRALFLITLTMLITGFWPFNIFPGNHIAWDSKESGILFDNQSMLITPVFPAPQDDFSMEVLIRPHLRQYNGIARIVSFCDPEGTEDWGFIGQWKTHLVIEFHDRTLNFRYRKMGIRDLLAERKNILLTIASGQGTTDLYVNGVKLRTNSLAFNLLPAKGAPCRLVLGNSPNGKSSWSGMIAGLSFYDRKLTPEQALEFYHQWTQGKSPRDKHPEALLYYNFSEKSGEVIHDAASGHDIRIEKSFKPLKLNVLTPITKDFTLSWNYLQDVLLNFFGFAPFGFFMAMLMLRSGRFSRFRIALWTAILGFLFSLTIELLQVYIPSRTSQMSDVLFNTMGTILGLGLFLICVRRYKLSSKEES